MSSWNSSSKSALNSLSPTRTEPAGTAARISAGTSRSHSRIRDRADERSLPASVGLKSFSSGIGNDAAPAFVLHAVRSCRVVQSYSLVFHDDSSGPGRWYLQEGT